MSRNFEERVAKNMALLHITREEAEEIVRDEDVIDKGGKCDWEVELTPEQKKAQRAARRADRPVAAEKKTRVRTENPDKRNLMDAIKAGIEGSVANIDITNPEREMEFMYRGVKYKITLSAPRK